MDAVNSNEEDRTKIICLFDYELMCVYKRQIHWANVEKKCVRDKRTK